MSQSSFNSSDKEVRPIPAKTDWTLKGVMYDQDQVLKNLSGARLRVHIRASPQGRVLKTYSHSTGGITMTSATYGRFYVSVSKSDVAPITKGVVDVVEYGKTYASGPRGRWRLSFTAE
jgi:hypothetical protein